MFLIIIGHLWSSVKTRPGVSDDLCEFVWCCGGYHRKDIRNMNTPNDMNAARRVSIYLMYYTETTVRMIDGIAGTTPLAVLALI